MRPYLPVVMLSKQSRGDIVIDAVDRGACSFIFKLDFTPTGVEVEDLARQLDAGARKKWTDAINKIDRLIARYRPIKRLLGAPLTIGVITKEGGATSAIPDQIKFLEYVEDISAINVHFPSLSRPPWKEGYEMPFYNLKSLRRVILEEVDQEVCLESTMRNLSEVLGFAFDTMYQHDVRTDVYSGYLEDFYWGKLEKRIVEAEAVAGSETGAVPALARGYCDLLRADRIVIGARVTESRWLSSRNCNRIQSSSPPSRLRTCA